MEEAAKTIITITIEIEGKSSNRTLSRCMRHTDELTHVLAYLNSSSTVKRQIYMAWYDADGKKIDEGLAA